MSRKPRTWSRMTKRAREQFKQHVEDLKRGPQPAQDDEARVAPPVTDPSIEDYPDPEELNHTPAVEDEPPVLDVTAGEEQQRPAARRRR